MLTSGGTQLSHAQTPPGVQWERSFGGSDADAGSIVKSTSDGGYILGGYSYSDISGSKTTSCFGLGDYWVVKLDASGNKQWDQSCGGNQFDGIQALQQTSDGGYLLGGISFSDASGNKASASQGAGDFWIVRLSASGNKQWDKTFGGTNLDSLTALSRTSDGGCVLGGTSFSGISGNKSSAGFGPDSGDYWMVKLDGNGSKQWEKSFGGNDLDELHGLQQTSDGGYILGGHSSSGVSGNKTSANLGNGTSDYWIVKLDAGGNKQWEKTCGGNDVDELYAIQQTIDGGYILGGHSYSGVSGHKTSGSFGSHDYWVVKLDSNGNKQWDQSCGGEDEDRLISVQQRTDGGYVLGGVSFSGVSGNKTSASGAADSGDYWIVSLDANGNKQSEQSLRRGYGDEFSRLQSTPDGASVLAGLASSFASADVDYAVTKLMGLLRFNWSSFGADRVYRAQLTGASGANYILHASTNLVHWRPLATNRAANGVVDFVDAAAASFPKRFYRVQPADN